MDIVAGRNAVREALRGRRRVRRVHTSHKHMDAEIASLISRERIPVEQFSPEELDRLSPDVMHQGVIAEVDPYPYVSLGGLIDLASARSEPVVLLLDGITDPMNFGALVRSALAFGVVGIIVGKSRSVTVNATVARASAGAVEHIPICRWNLSQAARELKKAGFWLTCASSHTGDTVWQADLGGKLALVLGAEGQGVSAGLQKDCDFSVSIPIAAKVESLNVSVAGAVLMAEIARRRVRSKE